jgi:hypothetical protein
VASRWRHGWLHFANTYFAGNRVIRGGASWIDNARLRTPTAVHHLQASLAENVDIAELARTAGMSRAASSSASRKPRR